MNRVVDHPGGHDHWCDCRADEQSKGEVGWVWVPHGGDMRHIRSDRMRVESVFLWLNGARRVFWTISIREEVVDEEGSGVGAVADPERAWRWDEGR